jgi:hypothetical protein
MSRAASRTGASCCSSWTAAALARQVAFWANRVMSRKTSDRSSPIVAGRELLPTLGCDATNIPTEA